MDKTEVFVVADRDQRIGFWDYAQNDKSGMPVILGAVPGSMVHRILISTLILLTLVFAIIPANIAAFADEPNDNLIDAIYLKSSDVGTDDKLHFVGEDFESKYKIPSITVKGKTIQLYAYYETVKSGGVTYETVDSTSPLGPVLLQWSSSDNTIATVSPDGLIIPVNDGTVTITATVTEETKYSGSIPSKSVVINVSGQTAEYVKSVTVIDSDGNILSSKADVDTVINGPNKFFEFYALVVWHDPNTGKDRTEDTRADAVTSTITWTVGGSSVVGTINKDTGRFKSTEYSGNCFVQCQVTGGVNGATIKDIARVQVDTGEYAYKPANSLTLKVVYQEFPDKIVQEHTYSLSELAGKLSSYTNSYTVLGGSRYGTIRATGYLFKDVLALEGVDIADVFQYRFTTADGYDNPITSKLLFGSGSRYYFPNWDISSRADAQVVPPLLAYSSNLIWGVSEVDYSAPLDDATRFRLVFGPLWSADSNSSFQIYYIGTITIVLTGAPPADNGKGKGNISGDGIGSGNGDGNGSGGTGVGYGYDGNDKGISKIVSGIKNGAGKAAATKEPAGGDWKLYEMISNSKSTVAPLNMDLPYLPMAIPIAGAGFLAGGLTFYIGYRRRLI